MAETAAETARETPLAGSPVGSRPANPQMTRATEEASRCAGDGPARSRQRHLPRRAKGKQAVTRVRAAWAALLALAFLLQRELDDAVEAAWQSLRDSPVFQHDSFEPVIATASFAFWLFFFQFLDDFLPLHQYVINPAERRKDKHTGIPPRAGAAYLGVIMTYDYFFPRRNIPASGPGSFAKVLLDIFIALVVYDALFFPIHLAMHRMPALRFIHARHHESKALYSTEVLRHSLVDGSLQVAVNILTLNLLRLHPFTRMCYNIVITYMLTEIHSGLDLPYMLHNVLSDRVLGGPPRHEEHHRFGTHNYQQFFTYLDDLVLPWIDSGFAMSRHARGGADVAAPASREAAAKVT
mmetsp:Transcript_10353/g.29234  ORF Transcript_10353/g.29234 Transcript_10353/m.29234 type:complete len:352 (-) Transcript_10353:210-1265(-)